MEDVVTLKYRDVIKDGFTVIAEVDAGSQFSLFLFYPIIIQFFSIFMHRGIPSNLPDRLACVFISLFVCLATVFQIPISH